MKSKSLLSGSATYLVSNILNAAIPFALLPILTRHLSPEEYGQVAMFQTLLAALAAFVGLSVAGAANRRYFDDEASERGLADFIGACVQILLASSLLAAAIIFVFQKSLQDWLGLQPKWMFLAVFAAACNVMIQFRLGQWQVRKKAYSYGALQISQSALNMLLSLLFVVALTAGAGGRIAAQVWATGVFALVALYLLRRDSLVRLRVWNPADHREALSFGIPLVPHIAGAFLLASVDRFVINVEIGLAEAGIYMVGVQLASAIFLVFDAINRAYVPWLFERLKRDIAQEKLQIVQHTYAWFILILLGAGCAFLVGPWLVKKIAGDEFAQAGGFIGWLVLGQCFGGMYLMVTNYIFYSKRTGLLSLATISSGLINVALLFPMIRLFGLQGAAMAFAASTAIRFLLTWWIAHKRHPMPWFGTRYLS